MALYQTMRCQCSKWSTAQWRRKKGSDLTTKDGGRSESRTSALLAGLAEKTMTNRAFSTDNDQSNAMDRQYSERVLVLVVVDVVNAG